MQQRTMFVCSYRIRYVTLRNRYTYRRGVNQGIEHRIKVIIYFTVKQQSSLQPFFRYMHKYRNLLICIHILNNLSRALHVLVGFNSLVQTYKVCVVKPNVICLSHWYGGLKHAHVQHSCSCVNPPFLNYRLNPPPVFFTLESV